MSSTHSAGASRRRQRSVRVTVAVCLLLVAALVVVAALLLGSLMATSAAVLALLCGSASTRIVLNELAQSRRGAARDRAAQAHAYQLTFAERIAEHDRFTSTMTGWIIERDAEIGRLLGTLRLADRRADEAEDRARREARRNVELQELVDAAARELDEHEDSLAFWGAGEAPTVVDLLAWEERVSAVSADQPEERREA